MKHLMSLYVLWLIPAVSAAEAMHGAYSPVPVTNTEVIASAKYAVTAQE